MQKKKTVLHLLKLGEYSGAENVVITIIDYMHTEQTYDSIYVSVSGEIDHILKEHGIKHAVLNEVSIKELQRVEKEYHPDIIHAHDFTMSVLAARIHTSAKRISHLHNNPPWIGGINLKSIAFALASLRYDAILGVSMSVFDEYRFRHFLQKKAIVVGNPIAMKTIIEEAKKAKEYEKSEVLFLGRLTEQKNPLRFIHLMEMCYTRFGDMTALMLGQGELQEQCEDMICQKGLQNIVQLLGFKNNPYGYLKHTKVLCVPSKWEGFGLVVVEAFALGIPVVATPVGGMKKLVTRETGLLSESDDELADEICRLLTDDKYYQVKSSASMMRATELDNLSDYMNQIRLVYE